MESSTVVATTVEKKPETPLSPKTEGKPSSQKRLLSRNDLEKSKRELRTLSLERELVSGALTRLYEAEAAGQITKEEREVLAGKYRSELKELDSKIVKIDALVEVGDLETLRDQLLQLINEKVEAIDRRIERVKVVASPLLNKVPEIEKKPAVSELYADGKLKPAIPDISDMLSKPQASTAEEPEKGTKPLVTSPPVIAEPVIANVATTQTQIPKAPNPRRRESNSDGQVEELQKELLEALDRLEKLDLET